MNLKEGYFNEMGGATTAKSGALYALRAAQSAIWALRITLPETASAKISMMPMAVPYMQITIFVMRAAM
jgi:hypothetical protein